MPAERLLLSHAWQLGREYTNTRKHDSQNH